MSHKRVKFILSTATDWADYEYAKLIAEGLPALVQLALVDDFKAARKRLEAGNGQAA